MRIFVLLLAASVLSPQDKPEQTLKQIEETLQKAKTVRIETAVVGLEMKEGREGKRTEIACRVLLKPGDRANIALTVNDPKRPGRPMENNLRCNGKRFGYVSDGKLVNPKDAWEGLGSIVKKEAALCILWSLGRLDAKWKDWDGAVKDVKFTAKDSISYSLTDPAGQSVTMTVDFDPGTLAVKQRTLKTAVQADGEWFYFTETVKEWALDVEIPDSEFELPKE